MTEDLENMKKDGLEEKRNKEEKESSSLPKAKRPWMLISLIFFVSVAAVFVVGLQLLKYQKAMVEDRKIQVRALVENAYDIVDMYRLKYEKGILTKKEAQHFAKQTLRDLRHSRSEYFWINDKNGVMLMHPILPELNGQNLLNLEDKNGFFIFREFTRIVDKKGEGYVSYVWPKPGEDKNLSFPKISYLKGMQGWPWIVGSGVYMDDIETSFRQAVYIAGALMFALVFLGITLWFTVSESFGE